jgi:hypothetical protein
MNAAAFLPCKASQQVMLDSPTVVVTSARTLPCTLPFSLPPWPFLAQYPLPSRSLVRGGQTSPHRLRLIVSHITCPPLSSRSPPPEHSYRLGPAVINNTVTHCPSPRSPVRGGQTSSHKPHLAAFTILFPPAYIFVLLRFIQPFNSGGLAACQWRRS